MTTCEYSEPIPRPVKAAYGRAPARATYIIAWRAFFSACDASRESELHCLYTSKVKVYTMIRKIRNLLSSRAVYNCIAPLFH